MHSVVKFAGAPFVIVGLYLASCVVASIPFLDSPSFDLIATPEPTVTVAAGDLDLDDANNEVALPMAEAACKRVPFLMRGIASPPVSVRVVLSVASDPVGELRINCRTGQVISGSERRYD